MIYEKLALCCTIKIVFAGNLAMFPLPVGWGSTFGNWIAL